MRFVVAFGLLLSTVAFAPAFAQDVDPSDGADAQQISDDAETRIGTAEVPEPALRTGTRLGSTPNVVTASTVTVTYVDQRTNTTIERTVDGAAFVPESASDLGLAETFAYVNPYNPADSGERGFATWVDIGNCAYWDFWERCRTVAGPYYDPGVLTPLTTDVTLAAVYAPRVAIRLLCQGQASDVAYHGSVSSIQFKLTEIPAVTDPRAASPEEVGGCGEVPGYYYTPEWTPLRNSDFPIDGNLVRPTILRPTVVASINPVKVNFVLSDGGATSGGVNVGLFGTQRMSAGETVTSWDGTTFGEGSYTWSQYWNQTNMVAITHNLAKDGYASSPNYSPSLSFAHSPGTYLNDFITDYQASLAGAAFDWSTFPTEITVGITTSYDTSFRIRYDGNSPSAATPSGSLLGTYSAYGIHGVRGTAVPAGCVRLSPDKPTVAGFTFVGWNTAADGTGATYSPSAEVCGTAVDAGDTTFYAQWSTNVYNVNFLVGFNSSYSNDWSSQMSLDQTIVLPGLPDVHPGREGYELAGWSTQFGATVAEYEPGDPYTLVSESHVDLFSVWSPVTQEVRFQSNPGGGSTLPLPSSVPEPMVGDSNADITLPAGPSRVGYNFAGWNTKADGSGTSYAAAAPFNVGVAESTLYATWTPKQYDILWFESDGTPKDAGGPNRKPGSVIYNPGTEGLFDTDFTLSSSANSEYPATVESLNTAQDGSGLSFQPGDVVSINEDTIPVPGEEINLYQQVSWRAQFNFWCDSNLFTCDGSQQAQYEYKQVVEGSASTISSDDITLYALNGWTFAGWDATSDNSDSLFMFNEPFDLDDSIGADFTAQSAVIFDAAYQPRSQIAKFDPQGGEEVPAIIFPSWNVSGDSTKNPLTFSNFNQSQSVGFVVPDAPVRPGRELKEWNTSPDGTGIAAAPGDRVHPGINNTLDRFADVVMYAIWKDSQTLTYDGPAEFSLQSLESGAYSNGMDLVKWWNGAVDTDNTHITSTSDVDIDLQVDAGSTQVCSLTGDTNGSDGTVYNRAQWRVQFAALGTCTLTASQSGTADVAAAIDLSFSIEVLGVEQSIAFPFSQAQSGGMFVILQHTYGQYDNPVRFEFPDVVMTLESLTPDVCTASYANANNDSMIVSNVGGGTCRIKVSQDGTDVNGGSTLFQATESIYEVFFKYTQNPQVNNDGVVPFITGDVDSFELDVDVVDELADNADWFSVEVDDDWAAQTNAAGDGPANSTTCTVGDDKSTVTILSTGNCGIFGSIPGNDEYEDWQYPFRGGTATGRYVIKEGFYLSLEVGAGTLEGTTRVIAADGMTVSLPAPTRDGYRFAGWNTSSDGSGTDFVIGDQTWSGSAAATLYAQWEVRAPILATDTSEPHAATGQANYVFPDGSKTETPLEVLSPTAIRAGEDEFEMDLEGNEDGAAEIDEVRQTLVFRTGKEGIATGRGFQPGSIAEIWLFSTPVFLGETIVLGDGTFAKTFDVPGDIEIGEHVIQAEGISAVGEPKAIAAGVLVAGATAVSPETGDGSGSTTETGDGSDSTTGDSEQNAALPATGATTNLMMMFSILTLALGALFCVLGRFRFVSA